MQPGRAALLDELKAYEPELIAIRRDLHRHPEIGFEEVRTAKIVAAKLRSWGVEVAEGIASTGVVGTIRGDRPGRRAIALRADLDALAIAEVAGRAHRSTAPGRMHACGHDGHVAMLLGAARRLARKPDFAGTVHVVFQPAEEGLGGGRAMIDEGLFDRFPVDAVYGLHNAPGLPAGAFATRKGPFMAASDAWSVVFRGTDARGPRSAVDPLPAVARFIGAVPTIAGPGPVGSEAGAVTIGHVAAGRRDAPTLVPPDALVGGAVRSHAPGVRDSLQRRLTELACACAAESGCVADVAYARRYPTLVNHAEQTDIALAAARAVVGERAVTGDAPMLAGSEDFAFMLEAKAGSFVMIGNGVESDGSWNPVHTPEYDFNDAILTVGAAYWVSLVAEELG